MGLTRARLLVAVGLILVVPTALWLAFQDGWPVCEAAAARRDFRRDAILGHGLGSGLLLVTATWARVLRARWLAGVAAYAVLCLAVQEAWYPVAAAGFALALQGVGLVLLGISAALLAYAVAHPRALKAPSRRRDHARMLLLLLVLVAIGVQGELAVVLSERGCG
jgi:hypothetical protein